VKRIWHPALLAMLMPTLEPRQRYISPIFDPPAPSPAVQEIDRARQVEQRRRKRARRKRKHARGF